MMQIKAIVGVAMVMSISACGDSAQWVNVPLPLSCKDLKAEYAKEASHKMAMSDARGIAGMAAEATCNRMQLKYAGEVRCEGGDTGLQAKCK